MFAPSQSTATFGMDSKSRTDAGVYSLLSMRRSEKLFGDAPIPSEHALLSLWRQTFLAAESNPLSASLLGSPSSHLVASLDPSIELTGRGSSQVSGVSSKEIDKREQVSILHKEAPIEFLRKHGLNGSIGSVLKKKNKAAISEAFKAWIIEKQATGKHLGSDQLDRDNKSQLELSFEVIYRRFYKSACEAQETNQEGQTVKRVTLMLLHEDYPQELPVFGGNCRVGDKEDSEHLIICVLGAVRDINQEEESAALAAANALRRLTPHLDGEQVQVQAVGCNLGRTPEFTSKIVATIGCHAAQGRLGSAVDGLTGIDLDRLQSYPCKKVIRNSNEEKPCGAGGHIKRHRIMEDYIPKVLNKLAALQSVSRTKFGQEASKAPSMSPPGSAIFPEVRIHFIFPIDFPLSVIPKAISTFSMTNSTNISHEMVQARTVVFPLVQTLVVALWRSRINGEAVVDSTSNSRPNYEGKCTIPSIVLHIVASDGIASLDQYDFVSRMAKNHSAAPCESQVLRALQAHLSSIQPLDLPANHNDSSIVTELLSKVKSGSRESLSTPIRKKYLMTLLPEGTLRSGAKIYTLSGNDQFKAFYNTAYAETCVCGLTGASANDSNDRMAEVVVLSRGPTDMILVQHMQYHGRLLPALSSLRKAKKREKELKYKKEVEGV